MIGHRDPVSLDGPTPEYANPGYLLHGDTTERAGMSRRCIKCDVRWHGDPQCFVCNQPAYTPAVVAPKTPAQNMADALQAGLRAVDGLAS